MEPVLHVLRYIYDRACLHGAIFVSNLDLGLALHHVVHLILCVRLLQIHTARGENVQSHAEIGDLEKFEIQSV